MRMALAVLLWLVAQTIPTMAAEATVFRESCAKCHERAERLARTLVGTRSERVAVLSEFLKTHHAADSLTRDAIVSYLVDLSLE